MNQRQTRFVAEYLVDGNASAAARRAGYSAKTAASQGHDLLKVPEISERIKKAQDKLVAKVGATVEDCFNVLAGEMKAGERSGDRIKAAEVLLKLQHKVSEKIEHAGSVSIVVRDPYSKDREAP